MTADKTGASTTVTAEKGRYTIAVEGEVVGHALYADRDNQRVFYHTEVEPRFGGRGLATILVEQTLNETRDAGKRVVPVCSMIAPCSRSIPNSTTSPTRSLPRLKGG